MKSPTPKKLKTSPPTPSTQPSTPKSLSAQSSLNQVQKLIIEIQFIMNVQSPSWKFNSFMRNKVESDLQILDGFQLPACDITAGNLFDFLKEVEKVFLEDLVIAKKFWKSKRGKSILKILAPVEIKSYGFQERDLKMVKKSFVVTYQKEELVKSLLIHIRKCLHIWR